MEEKAENTTTTANSNIVALGFVEVACKFNFSIQFYKQVKNVMSLRMISNFDTSSAFLVIFL